MKKIIILFGFLMTVGALAQPTGTCSTGITKFGTDGIFYGCVEGVWKRLSENTTSAVSIPGGLGTTHNVNGVVYVREMDNTVRALNNAGFTPISLAGHTHQVGKIIYDTTQKHFYQGVSGGLWHRIDNNELQGYPIMGKLIIPKGEVGNTMPLEYELKGPTPESLLAFVDHATCEQLHARAQAVYLGQYTYAFHHQSFPALTNAYVLFSVLIPSHICPGN